MIGTPNSSDIVKFLVELRPTLNDRGLVLARTLPLDIRNDLVTYW